MSDQLVCGSTDVGEAARVLADADRIFIAAGAGMSAAAGYDYTDETSFARLFPWLRSAGFTARYQLIGYPLPPRQQWGFWAVHVEDIRFDSAPARIYTDLRSAIGSRDHFVATSNVDGLFGRNGFDRTRVFTPQGDYALYQCRTPCTRRVWDAQPLLTRARATLDVATGMIAADCVPRCPNCGGDVYLNVNAGSFYVADHFWPIGEALNDWLAETHSLALDGARLVIVEVGAGYNTPSVVRYPSEAVARAIPNATHIRINRDHAGIPRDLSDSAYSLEGDAASLIERLLTR